jgi:membrane associated rhomboid family serine protease
MGNIHPAVLVIIALNVLMSYKGFEDFSFREKFKFNIAGIRRGEQIRMISSGFLHADWGHLGFNMLTLYFFANTVINSLGVMKFVILYIASLLVGNMLSFFMHKDEYHYSALGASGAVMGVLYSAILLQPNSELRLYFAIPIKAWLFGLLYLGYSVYGMKKQHDNIGHDAHLGGAVAGYLVTLLFVPSVLETDLLIKLSMMIPIVVLFVMYRMGKI